MSKIIHIALSLVLMSLFLFSCGRGETSITAADNNLSKGKTQPMLTGIVADNDTDTGKNATKPLKATDVTEEFISRAYSASVFSDGPCTSKISPWDPLEKEKIPVSETRMIDENYYYSVYKTESGALLYAFGVRDDSDFVAELSNMEKSNSADYVNRCWAKNYVLFFAYVEKPMKMDDFKTLKAGDSFDDICRIDPGIRYISLSGMSLHLCSDGLVILEYDDSGKISNIHFRPDFTFKYEDLCARRKAHSLGSGYDAETFDRDCIGWLKDISLTCKIDPADYPSSDAE